MFERETELRALDEALTHLCDARTGGLLCYAGAPGVGKTALLTEVRRRAVARGCTVMPASGAEQEQELAFHVVRQLVQPVLASASEAEHERLLGGWSTIVAHAVGLVATEEGGSPDPQGVRDGLDWVVTRFAVQQAPVVMVVDDAHWIDAESLAWLTAFAPRAESLPILIVVAYRPEELPFRTGPFRQLADRRGSRPHELRALSLQGVSRIVRDVLGPGADDAFCRECWTVTAGNPFEVVELTARFSHEGLKPQPENLPRLRELASAVKGSGLVESLERMGSGAVRLAWATAVLGTGIAPELASRLAALDSEKAAQAREQLRAARVLRGGEHERDLLEFFHPLVATAVYQAIPAAMRVVLHGQAAALVADAGHGATAAARHLLETYPECDPRVVAVLRSAAREYQRAGAPDAARRCLARALREPPSYPDRAAVLFELGCSSLLTEPAVTVNHLRAALEEPEISAELREAITYRLTQALGHSGRMEEAAQTVAEEARRATDARTRLRMQAEQFTWNAMRADEPDSAARSRLLARFADRLTGDELAERYILGLRAWDALVRGEPATTALRYADAAMRGGMSWTDENWGFEVPLLVAMVYMYCDQPGRAEELFSEGIAECERKGWRGSHLACGLSFLGYIRYRRGRLGEAEDLVREGLRIADRVGQGAPAQWAAIGTLIEILIARGSVEQAWQLAEHYRYGDEVPRAVVYPDAQAVHAELLLALGRRRDAQAQLESAGARLEARGMGNPSWCPWQLQLAATVAPTEPARAVELAEEAVRRARRFGTSSGVGQALHAAALVTSGARQRELLTEAVHHLERSPAGYDLARALVDLGVALRRFGTVQEAADQLYRGLENALACGADALAARARQELAQTGLRSLQLYGTGSPTLSGQELTAAEQAARGRSEEQIAEELGLDRQQVARLLSRVYRTLGTDHLGLARRLAEGRVTEGRTTEGWASEGWAVEGRTGIERWPHGD